MRVVIHDEETGEALTVVHIPRLTNERIRHMGRVIYLAALPPVSAQDLWKEVPSELEPLPIVRLRAEERRHPNGNTSWLFYTRDSENALTLDATVLPGQWRLMNEIYEGRRVFR